MASPEVPITKTLPGQRRCTSVRLLFCALFCLAMCLSDSIGAAQSTAPVRPSGIRDFVEYWSAGRLLLQGTNPYAPVELLRLQQSVGWPTTAPLIMWNPPWTLSLTLPFALLDFPLGQFAWLFTQVVIVLVSVHSLARLYGNPSATCRVEWCLAFTFVPTVFALILGQITPLVLAGISGFVVLESKGRRFLAGIALALVSIKPHLLYLFWLVLLLWIIRERQWRIVAGTCLAMAVLALTPLAFYRDIYGRYLDLYSLVGVVKPFDWPTPTLRNIATLLLDRRDVWLQGLPTVAGVVWLGYYWQRRKLHWRWADELPWILLVSVTSSFFAWTYDQVILIPALIEVAVWLKGTEQPWYRSRAVLGYLIVNVVHAAMRFWYAEEFHYVWLAPALLLCYLLYRVDKKSPTPAIAGGGS